MKNNQFQNKVVLITGASSGIGRSTALRFARQGAKTVLLSRSQAKLELVAEEIREFSDDVFVVPADVSSKTEVEAAVEKTLKKYGRIDVLFNNAGLSHVGRADEPRFVDDLRGMFEVDLLGAIHVTQAVLPAMRRQGSGHILNMSSVVGRKAFPGFGGYSSIMHALVGYTNALRQELQDEPISVSIIHPALTQTPLLSEVSPEDMPPPFRRLTPISPELVAKAALDGIHKNTARIVVPALPRLLMLADALSPHLGDLFVRLLQKRWFSRLFGTFRGATYAHRLP